MIKNLLIEESNKLPKYTSFNEISHSFNQVIGILKKAFELFEEHFSDLLELPQIKDFSNQKDLNSLLSIKQTQMSLDRTSALIDSKKISLEFKEQIDPLHDYNLNSISMLTEDLIVTSSIDRSIHIYSIKDKRIVLNICSMRFSPMTLCPIRTLLNPESIKVNLNKKFEYSLIASGGGDYDPTITIWSLRNSKKILSLPGHNRHITTIVQLPDCNMLASGGYDSKIFIWDLLAGEPKLILTRHTFWIFKLKVSPCNTKLASCSWDRSVIIWKIIYDENDKNNYIFKDLVIERILTDNYEVSNINFSLNDPNIIISSNIGRFIKFWNIKTGSFFKEIKLKQSFANEIIVLENHNSKKIDDENNYIIISGIDDNKLRVYNIKTEEEEQALENELIKITAYNVSPKIQLFKQENGELALVCVNHDENNLKLGIFKIVEK